MGKTPCDCRTAVCDERAESRQARRGTNSRRAPKPKEKETWDLEPNPKPKTQQRQPGETAARGSTGRRQVQGGRSWQGIQVTEAGNSSRPKGVTQEALGREASAWPRLRLADGGVRYGRSRASKQR